MHSLGIWGACLALQSYLTTEPQLECVQKTSMKVILGREYKSASTARKVLKLHTLEKRQNDICLKFGLKATKSKNHSKWFKPNQCGKLNLRKKLPKYKTPFCRTKRFYNSSIPYLTRIVNESEN